MNYEKKFASWKIYDAKGDITKRWFVYTTRNGKRVKLYGDINTWPDAATRRARALAIIAEQTKAEAPATGHLSEVWKALEQRKNQLRPKTWQTYVSKYRRLVTWASAQGLDRVQPQHWTSDHIKDFLASMGRISPTTWNHYTQLFRGIWRDILLPGVRNPWDGVKYKKQNPTPALYFSEFQIRELKEAIQKQSPQLWLCCQFIYYCFIRPGELRNLKIGDIQFKESRILIRGEVAKNKRQQYVAIPEAFKPMIARLEGLPQGYYVVSAAGEPGETRIGHNWMKINHQAVLTAKGYDTRRHKLYSWKHTGAIAAVKAGISLKYIQLQLRHSSLDQVNAYLKDIGLVDIGDLVDRFPEI